MGIFVQKFLTILSAASTNGYVPRAYDYRRAKLKFFSGASPSVGATRFLPPSVLICGGVTDSIATAKVFDWGEVKDLRYFQSSGKSQVFN